MELGDNGIAALIGVGGTALGTVLTWFINRGQTQAANDRAERESARADRQEARADREEKRANEERDSAAEERKQFALEREKERREQRLFDALQYFAGGSQKRNVGISVVEGAWRELPDWKATLRPLLVNQALYLLLVSDEIDDWHERDNLRRLMRLVLEDHEDPEGRRHYSDLRAAVKRRLADVSAIQPERAKTSELRGVEVHYDDLSGWSKALRSS